MGKVAKIKLWVLKEPRSMSYPCRFYKHQLHMVMDISIRTKKFRILHFIKLETDVFKLCVYDKKTKKETIHSVESLKSLEYLPKQFSPLLASVRPVGNLKSFMHEAIECAREVSRDKTFDKDAPYPYVWIWHEFAKPIKSSAKTGEYEKNFPQPKYFIEENLETVKNFGDIKYKF